MFSAATNVPVTSYAMPPSAPQKGTSDTLDTLEGRLTNAVAAIDPARGGVAVWTQHTVQAAGTGLGSEVRWYEINPSTGALFQKGVVRSSSFYVFMAAIAPDRNGMAGAFGSNMVLGFNASSASAIPAVGMASKVGTKARSKIVKVAVSPQADTEITCAAPYGPPCRWGDYSGASPDPASPSGGAEGMVWLSLMLANGGTPSTVAWSTQDFAVQP